MKIVIVGGVAAGASCAARISRLDKNAEIVMLEKSSHVSYANCGLPYYVGNVIKDEGALTVQTKEQFKAKICFCYPWQKPMLWTRRMRRHTS